MCGGRERKNRTAMAPTTRFQCHFSLTLFSIAALVLSSAMGTVPTTDIRDPLEVFVADDSSAVVCVTFTGDPEPEIEWEKNDGSGWTQTGHSDRCARTPGNFTVQSGGCIRACGTNVDGRTCTADVWITFVQVQQKKDVKNDDK